MRKLFLFLVVLAFLCGQAFAAGNIIEDGTYEGVSPSNIIYSSKTEAKLLKTGQNTSYHADDDGDLELGVAHDYTVLTTGRYAGSTNVTINSKTYAFSNACVQDNRTGKMWARTVPQSDIGPAANGALFWEQYTLDAETCTCNAAGKTITADAGTPFSTNALCAGRIFTILGSAAGNNGTFTVASITTSAITVVEAVTDEASISLDFATVDDLIWDLVDEANANGLAGYTDWRIPNIVEIRNLVNFSVSAPAIDTITFPSTPSSPFWTSTSAAVGSAGIAWRFDFLKGSAAYIGNNKYIEKHYIRLVRN